MYMRDKMRFVMRTGFCMREARVEATTDREVD
jgi:hypothetical protein